MYKKIKAQNKTVGFINTDAIIIYGTIIYYSSEIQYIRTLSETKIN